MRPTLRIVAAVVVLGLTQTALGQAPIARVELRDAEPVMVSAGARLSVDVLVPTFFNGPIQFPDEIELSGAIVILAPGSSVNLSERIDGTQWAGNRRTYRVYPLQPGTVTIDALAITVSYALPSGGSSGPTVVRTPPLQLRAYVPDPARALSQFFAADTFTVTSSSAPDGAPEGTTVRVGETVTRSYTMAAEGTPGLFLPSLTFADIDGARAYAAQPQLSEGGGQRGTARTATRIEGVTYTFERTGEFEIPGATVNWWDTAADELRQEVVAPLRVTVVANPDLDAAMLETDAAVEVEAPQERRWVAWLRGYWRPLLAALVLLLAGRRFLVPCFGRFRAWLDGRRRAAAASEPRYFRNFVTASHCGDAATVHAAMTRWLDRWDRGSATPTLASFAAEHGTRELQRQVAALGEAAFGNAASDWSGQTLARSVDVIRRQKARTAEAPPALAPLNPV
jgi:hypothetical protein